MAVADYLASLRTRRDAVAAEIAAIDTTKAGGLPDSDGTGVNTKHQAYKKGLYDELASLDDLIAKAEAKLAADAGDLGIVETQEW